MLQPPTIADIRTAAERIQGAVIRTPMLVSRTLSELIGAEVWLKFENLQFTAAYKERGELMSGISIAARAVKPDIELIGVEAELYPSMKCAIEGCHLPLGGDTLAEGIAVKQPGELTSRILGELANDVVLVAERDIERAVARLVGIEKSVVEGAGAAGRAAMLADPGRLAGQKVA